MMKNETQEQQKKKYRWIPGIIRHDWERKILALFLTALVTGAVYSDKRKSMETDLNFNNVKPEFVLEDGYKWEKLNPQKVTLTLRGPRNVLSDLKVEDFEIRKSIADREYQDKHVKLDVKDVICHHPKSGLIQVTGVTPQEYTVHLQKIVTKDLLVKTDKMPGKNSRRIRIDLAGELPPGYFFDGAEILDGNKVKVTGPETFLKSIRNIQMEPVPLNNHVSTFVTTAKLIQPDPNCTLDRSSVKVRVYIGRYLIRKFEYVPIQVIATAEMQKGAVVTIPEDRGYVTVELMGEKNEFDTMGEENAKNHIYAFIRKSDLREGNNNMVHVQCAIANKRLRGLSVTPSAINGVVLQLPEEKEEKEEKTEAPETEPAKAEPAKTEAPETEPAKAAPKVESAPEKKSVPEGTKANDPQKK